MAKELLLTGDNLEELLETAHELAGPQPRILRAERLRHGGLLGAFGRDCFEVLVAVDDEAEGDNVAADSADDAAPEPDDVLATTDEPTPPQVHEEPKFQQNLDAWRQLLTFPELPDSPAPTPEPAVVDESADSAAPPILDSERSEPEPVTTEQAEVPPISLVEINGPQSAPVTGVALAAPASPSEILFGPNRYDLQRRRADLQGYVAKRVTTSARPASERDREPNSLDIDPLLVSERSVASSVVGRRLAVTLTSAAPDSETATKTTAQTLSTAEWEHEIARAARIAAAAAVHATAHRDGVPHHDCDNSPDDPHTSVGRVGADSIFKAPSPPTARPVVDLSVTDPEAEPPLSMASFAAIHADSARLSAASAVTVSGRTWRPHSPKWSSPDVSGHWRLLPTSSSMVTGFSGADPQRPTDRGRPEFSNLLDQLRADPPEEHSDFGWAQGDVDASLPEHESAQGWLGGTPADAFEAYPVEDELDIAADLAVPEEIGTLHSAASVSSPSPITFEWVQEPAEEPESWRDALEQPPLDAHLDDDQSAITEFDPEPIAFDAIPLPSLTPENLGSAELSYVADSQPHHSAPDESYALAPATLGPEYADGASAAVAAGEDIIASIRRQAAVAISEAFASAGLRDEDDQSAANTATIPMPRSSVLPQERYLPEHSEFIGADDELLDVAAYSPLTDIEESETVNEEHVFDHADVDEVESAIESADTMPLANALVALGVPAGWTTRLRGGDRFSDIFNVLELLPQADIDTEATTIAVVGAPEAVLLEATRVATDLTEGHAPLPIVHVPANSTMNLPAEIGRYHRSVVAIETDGSGDPSQVLEVLGTIDPQSLIVVLDADTDLHTVRSWLFALGDVSALSLEGVLGSAEPARMLQLDVPIIRLDGVPIDRTTWTALLCAMTQPNLAA